MSLLALTGATSLLQSILPLRKFPAVNYNFFVLAGIDFLGDFQSVTDISYGHTPFEIKEGGRNHSPHLRPFGDVSKRGEMKLKWGSVSWDTLYEWVNAVQIGLEFRREVYIVQLTRSGMPCRLMRCANAWPKEWKGSDLSTTESAWSVDELTIVYEHFNLIDIPLFD